LRCFSTWNAWMIDIPWIDSLIVPLISLFALRIAKLYFAPKNLYTQAQTKMSGTMRRAINAIFGCRRYMAIKIPAMYMARVMTIDNTRSYKSRIASVSFVMRATIFPAG